MAEVEDPAAGVVQVLHSCRCCLQRAPDRDLNTPHTHLGNTEIYANMLKECFDIQLALVNECGICEDCISRLRDASDFKLQVQRSQTELQARLEGALRALGLSEELSVRTESDDVADSTDNSTSLSWQDASPATEEPCQAVSSSAPEQLDMACSVTSVRIELVRNLHPPHECQICHLTFDHEATLTTHMRVHSELKTEECDTQEGKFICDTCGRRFALEYLLDKHKQNNGCVKAQVERKIDSEITTRESLVSRKLVHKRLKAYTCEVCKKQFRRKHYLNQHTFTHTGMKPQSNELFTCDTCRRQFARNILLIKHIQEKRCLSCEYCSKTFTSKRGLVFHELIHKGLKPYACEICNKQFRQKQHLNQHTFTHTGMKPQNNELFTCDTCRRQFVKKKLLIKHIQEKRCLSCEYCSKTFTSKRGLVFHELIHKGLKPYACEICNKQFRQKQHLNQHTFTHTGMKPQSNELFTCDTCRRQFVKKKWLLNHIQEKRCLCCEFCSKMFTSKQKLVFHELMHKGLKPYACEICNKQFRLKQHLNQHTFTHTGMKPQSNELFTCDTCRRQFVKKKWLLNHIQEKRCLCCEFCSKTFTSKQKLVIHELVHKGLKPYACEICNKQFRQKGHLNYHTFTHTGMKPYVCVICNRQFLFKGKLAEHLCKHTEPYQSKIRAGFTCDTCRRQFVKKKWLINHIQEKRCLCCEFCSKTFTSKRKLVVHELVHKSQGVATLRI